MIHKTSAMVEAGILAAVAIVMALISMYVPVLGAFVNFVWPLPIVICGCRHGLKWSIMTLLVATVIIAMIISPINAFFLAAIFGLLGLILGECMRRHLPPMKMMLYGSVGAVIALILNIVLSFWVLGIDPIEMMFSSFHQSLGNDGLLPRAWHERGRYQKDCRRLCRNAAHDAYYHAGCFSDVCAADGLCELYGCQKDSDEAGRKL